MGGHARLQPKSVAYQEISETRSDGDDEPRGPPNADGTVDYDMMNEDDEKNMRVTQNKETISAKLKSQQDSMTLPCAPVTAPVTVVGQETKAKELERCLMATPPRRQDSAETLRRQASA